MKHPKTVLAVAGLALAVTMGLAAVGSNVSAAPAPTAPGNVQTQQAARLVDIPGIALTNGGTATVQVSGHAGVAADATAAFLQLTSYRAASAGTLTVYTTGTGAPGTPTVQFAKGEENSTTTLVALDSSGRVTVRAAGATRFLLTALSAVVPAPAPIPGPKGDPGTDAGPMTTSGVTNVSARPDSGMHGNWATDSFGRTLSVTRHAAAPVSACGTTSGGCWFYTGTISDSGSFATDSGAQSPEAGTDINGTVTGSLVGGESVEFYASSDTAVQPAGNVSGATPTTTDWVKQDFAAGTHFSSVTTLSNWSWTYSAPGTCETWTNAGSGNTGDITGINHCTA